MRRPVRRTPARRDDTGHATISVLVLREAARAIGSQAAGSPGLHAREPATQVVKADRRERYVALGRASR